MSLIRALLNETCSKCGHLMGEHRYRGEDQEPACPGHFEFSSQAKFLATGSEPPRSDVERTPTSDLARLHQTIRYVLDHDEDLSQFAIDELTLALDLTGYDSDGQPSAGGMQMPAPGDARNQSPAHPKDTISGGPVGPSDAVERHPGPWIGRDAELARACAMAAIKDYGTDDPETHQRILRDGVWNDHVAVQAALAAIHHLRKAGA